MHNAGEMTENKDDATNGSQNTPRQGAPQRTQIVSRRFPRPGNDSILVCPVGGVGQIGMNWTLYGYAGKWILVDAGSAFAPRDVDGVDAIFPDPRSLRSILPNLSALIVTHAHEDHIGAIHRLWPALGAPILATPFAAKLIGNRLTEARTRSKVSLSTFNPGETLNVGPFSIQTVRMTHSVPECVSLSISTPSGTVFHSGDWKLDADPVIGRPTDIEALRQIGRKGVLGMVCDSTNADRRGPSTSERDVANTLPAIFRDTKGMVVLTCFATNVARIASFARAAAASGRQIGMAGRSLMNTEQAARECGLLDGVPEFLHDVRHLKGLDHREMALICTGSQGETNAAIGRLAAGDDFRLPAIQPGDAVIHSARAIPGNEDDINEILGTLAARGATIIRESYNGGPVHVTGHAVANELEAMYGYIRPRFAIPVHGEASHLAAHEKIARAAGVHDIGIASEGDVWRVSRRRIEKVATVKIDLLAALDRNGGNRMVPWDVESQTPVLSRKVKRIEQSEARLKVA
jgi:ribonuclease J